MGIELRPYQQAAVKAVLHEWDIGHNKTLLVLPTGCHGIGEKVLLADGQIKRVEEIQSDDLLLGSDGNPRHILQIIRGTGEPTNRVILSILAKSTVAKSSMSP